MRCRVISTARHFTARHDLNVINTRSNKNGGARQYLIILYISVFRKSVPCSKEKWKWGEHPSAQFHATYQKDKATQRRVVPHFTAGIMSSPPSNCFSCFGSASLMDFSPRKKSNWLFVPSSTVSSYYFSVASFNHLFSMFFFFWRFLLAL